MGKSFRERGDTSPKFRRKNDEDDEDFDYREYLKKQAEEEQKEQILESETKTNKEEK